MKLTTARWVSVDRVLQGIGGPDADRSGGFERRGWVAPLFDPEAGAWSSDLSRRADAFVFGRNGRTT
jgi:hypothetical protein